MTISLMKAWTEMVLPILQRPRKVQVAALCFRPGPTGIEVLLITSRDTGRWIVPKGWPIDGLNGSEAALQEAWEEAGVTRAETRPEPLGQYSYVKGLNSGGEAPVDTLVYSARVLAMSDRYPEVDQRSRKWVSPAQAAEMVDEPGLQQILRDF